MSITSKTETHFHNIEANTAMMGVDVTGNNLTTMSIQLQPDPYVMMMKQ